MRAFAHLANIYCILLVSVLAFAISGCGPKYPKCNKDEQCAEHSEVCVEGMCQQCRDDSTCPSGQVTPGSFPGQMAKPQLAVRNLFEAPRVTIVNLCRRGLCCSPPIRRRRVS